MADTMTNYPLVPKPVPPGSTVRYALVGCGRRKVAWPAPARELYTGSLFRATRRHVEKGVAAGFYDGWRIISARYGVVGPDEIVCPYEATMDGKTVDQLRQWVTRVDTHIRGGVGLGTWSLNGGHVIIDILASGAYADPLVTCWNGLDWEINRPLAGLGMTERIKRLSQNNPGSL